jgi:hypothetical protein
MAETPPDSPPPAPAADTARGLDLLITIGGAAVSTGAGWYSPPLFLIVAGSLALGIGLWALKRKAA